jgi:hypothetical protein
MMDQQFRRLLVIVVLVSFILCCSAQNPTSTEEDTKPTEEAVKEEDTSELEPSIVCDPTTLLCQEQDISKSDTANPLVHSSRKEDASKSEDSIICDPITKLCSSKHKPNTEEDTKSTKESVTEEDASEHVRSACKNIDGKTVCSGGHLDPKPTKEAVTEEDTSESEPSIVCDLITHLCQGGDSSYKSDIVYPPVESSGKEDASKSEDSIICDQITKICKGPQTDSVILEPTKGDLPKAQNWEFKPNPESPIVCNPETKKCTGPKQKSFELESGKAAQIEDFIQEEKDGIDFNVCRINPDGTKSCKNPKLAFGIAQPRAEAA